MKSRSIITLFTLLFAAGSVMLSGSAFAQDQTRDRLQLRDQVDEPDQDLERTRLQQQIQDKTKTPDFDQDLLQERVRDRLHERDDIAQNRDRDRERLRDQINVPEQDQDRIHQ